MKAGIKMKDILRILGFGIYIVTSLVNRFVVYIPDAVYIPIAVVSIGMIIAGFVMGRKTK